jgi:hypothetical protein
MKPLRPLDHGSVLIVGTKTGNFDDELRTHPRVILWESQDQRWTDKDVPNNVQAIFITRFIGHSHFDKILREARKKRITIFNPAGTGIIARQVKELLALNPPVNTVQVLQTPIKSEPIVTKKEETIVLAKNYPGKLEPLYKFIDLKKPNRELVETLVTEAEKLKISTTRASLMQLVVVRRRKAGAFQRKPAVVPVKTIPYPQMDVSVQILDEMIKGMQDMRAFLISTVEENQTLKSKIAKFKNLLGVLEVD